MIRPAPPGRQVIRAPPGVFGYHSILVEGLMRHAASIALALAIGAGCNSTTSSPITETDGSAFYSCDTEMRAVRKVAGLERTSTAGSFVAKLVTTDPDPPVKGNNTWTIEIDDATTAPVDGLAMKATPFMPDHNHGTSVKALVSPAGTGVYTITPLYLYMSGYWEVTVDITPASGPMDRVMFPVCIEG
jgi:hypothetical protein